MSDRLTARDKAIKDAYAYAKKQKGDRMTSKDVEAAEEMIESFSKDFTRGLPDEAYNQIDQEIKGFSMGSRAAIKGFKYGGVK